MIIAITTTTTNYSCCCYFFLLNALGEVIRVLRLLKLMRLLKTSQSLGRSFCIPGGLWKAIRLEISCSVTILWPLLLAIPGHLQVGAFWLQQIICIYLYLHLYL